MPVPSLRSAKRSTPRWKRSCHDAKVIRCCTVRDSNADILMIMQIDRPEQLGTYLQHPKHVALAQGMKDSIADRMSFDAE